MTLRHKTPYACPFIKVAQVGQDVVSVSLRAFELGVPPFLDVPLRQRIEVTLAKCLADDSGLAGRVIASHRAIPVLDLSGHSGRSPCHAPWLSKSRRRVEFHRANFRVEGHGGSLPEHTDFLPKSAIFRQYETFKNGRKKTRNKLVFSSLRVILKWWRRGESNPCPKRRQHWHLHV